MIEIKMCPGEIGSDFVREMNNGRMKMGRN